MTDYTKIPESILKSKDTLYRNYVGIFVCAFTVVSFIIIGFVLLAGAWLGKTGIEPPKEWMAAMLSLASTALGFLAGNRTSKK